jgi:hypothetical protein
VTNVEEDRSKGDHAMWLSDAYHRRLAEDDQNLHAL